MAEFTMNKLVALILVILVIAVVLMIIFKPSILDWIRNLPEYKYEYDEEIDFSKLSDEQRAAFCTGDLFLGKIKEPLKREGGKQRFIDIYYKNVPFETFLYWVGNDKEAEIKLYLYKKGILWEEDRVIANVVKGKISVKEEYLSETKEYIKIKNLPGGEKLPSPKVLETFNGAYYTQGNFICRARESPVQVCDRGWKTLSKKTFTLIFKGECGATKEEKTNFREGTCCLEVSNLYQKTREGGQKWYWSPDNDEYCKEFSNYDSDLIYDTTSGWKVRVWIKEKNQEILYFGGADCLKPAGYYNCELGFEEGFEKYGGVDVRDNITCKEVKEG